MRILIKNIEEIYSSGSKEIGSRSFVFIENKKIKNIAEMDQLPDFNQDYDYLIDAAGKIMLPGFINTHTHAAMTLMRGYADDMPLASWLQDKIWPFEAQLGGDDIYWGTALAVMEMIKSGTTAFADMYFAMDRTAAVVDKSGIRAVLAEGLIEANDGQKGLKSALDYALNYQNAADGRITTMLAPHAPYTCGRNYLADIKELAQINNLAVHIHLSESKTEVNDFKNDYNCSPIKFLDDLDFFDNQLLAAHCVHLLEGDLEILQAKKVNVAHNPMSNAKLANGIAPAAEFIKKGINVSLGTDGVSSNNSLDMIKEARMASYLQKLKYEDPTAVNTEELLSLLTVNGAKALGMENTAQIEVDKKADLILIDITEHSFSYPHHNNLSNLFYAADGRSVDTVIIDGKIVMENREVKTLDQEKIYFEADKRSLQIADELKSKGENHE